MQTLRMFLIKAKSIVIGFLFFSMLILTFSQSQAQFNLFRFSEIESGCSRLAKYYDSITYYKQQYFVSVYYLEFNVVKDCKKSYRIVQCEFISDLLAKRYNYYFTIYNRYFLFYNQDTVSNHNVKTVDPAFRDKLKFFVSDNSQFFCGDVGMGCVFNNCSKNKLYLAYAPGSRYKNAVKEEKKPKKRYFNFLRKRRTLF